MATIPFFVGFYIGVFSMFDFNLCFTLHAEGDCPVCKQHLHIIMYVDGRVMRSHDTSFDSLCSLCWALLVGMELELKEALNGNKEV